jgi:hypothetical protein
MFFIPFKVFFPTSLQKFFQLHSALNTWLPLFKKFAVLTHISIGAVIGLTMNFQISNVVFPEKPCSPKIFNAAAESSHKKIVPSQASATFTHCTFPSL